MWDLTCSWIKQHLPVIWGDDKGDLIKLSKNLAALAWTTSQREERSLEGGINNRFPEAPPKKAATPRKINACLGMSPGFKRLFKKKYLVSYVVIVMILTQVF